jgi:hypothetical protein
MNTLFNAKVNSTFTFLLLIQLTSLSQTDSVKKFYFQQRDFGKYFISDIYSPTMQIQVGMGLNLKDYNLSSVRNKYFVPYNQTDFGHEIPIFSKYKYFNNLTKSKVAISLPLCARLWFDFSEISTAPILNTDYNFAPLEFTYYRSLNRKYFKNFVIKFIPFFHESTHLGDELTLYRALDSLSIRRVNVSYETAELAFTLNDADIQGNKNWSFKLGLKSLLNPEKGWYSFRTIEADSGIIQPTKHWLESYLQIQKQSNSGFLASNKFINVFSVELRYRVQFGYPFLLDTTSIPNTYTEISNNERMQTCINAYYGWKFNFTKSTVPRFGVFLKGYLGINPYGQFRNIPFYTYYAISFIYQN